MLWEVRGGMSIFWDLLRERERERISCVVSIVVLCSMPLAKKWRFAKAVESDALGSSRR